MKNTDRLMQILKDTALSAGEQARQIMDLAIPREVDIAADEAEKPSAELDALRELYTEIGQLDLEGVVIKPALFMILFPIMEQRATAYARAVASLTIKQSRPRWGGY